MVKIVQFVLLNVMNPIKKFCFEILNIFTNIIKCYIMKMLYKNNFKHYLNQKTFFDQNVYNLKRQISLKKTHHPYKNQKIPEVSENQSILYMKCLAQQLQQQILLHRSFNTKSNNCEKKLAQLSGIIKKMSIEICFQTILKVLHCCQNLNINNLKQYFNEQQIKMTIDLLYENINKNLKQSQKKLNSKEKHSNSTQNLSKFYHTYRHRELSNKKIDIHKLEDKSETSRIQKHEVSRKFIDLILLYKIDELFVYLDKIYLNSQFHPNINIFSAKFFQIVNEMISCSFKIKIFYSQEEFAAFQANLKHLVKNTKPLSGFNQVSHFQSKNKKTQEKTHKKISYTQMKRISKSTHSNQEKVTLHDSLFKNGKNSSQQKRSSILPRQSLKSTKSVFKRRSGIFGIDSQSKKRISTRWNNIQGEFFGVSLHSKQKIFKRSSNFNLKKASSRNDSQFSNNYIQENSQSIKDENELSDFQSRKKISEQSLYMKKIENQFKSFYLYMKGQNGITLQVNKTIQINNSQNQNNQCRQTSNIKFESNHKEIQLVALNQTKNVFEHVALVITQLFLSEKDLKQSYKKILQNSATSIYQKEHLIDDLFYSCIKDMLQHLFVIVEQKNGFKLKIKKNILPLTRQLDLNYKPKRSIYRIQVIPVQKIQNNSQVQTFSLQYFGIVRKINTHFFRKLIFSKKAQKNHSHSATNNNQIKIKSQIAQIHKRLKRIIKRQKKIPFQFFKEHSLYYVQQTYCNTFSTLYESKKSIQTQLNIFNHNIYDFQHYQQNSSNKSQYTKASLKRNKYNFQNRQNQHKVNKYKDNDNENDNHNEMQLTTKNKEKYSNKQVNDNNNQQIHLQTYNIVCIQNNTKMNPSTIFIRQFQKKEKTNRFRSTVSNNQVSSKKIHSNFDLPKTKYIIIKDSKQYDFLKILQILAKFNIQQVSQDSFNHNIVNNPIVRKSKICFEQDKDKNSTKFNGEEVQKNNLMMDKIIQKSQQEQIQQEKTSKSLSRITQFEKIRNRKRSSSIILQLKNSLQINNQPTSKLKSLVRISSQLEKRSKLSKSSRNFSSMHTLIGYNPKQYQVLFKSKNNKNCYQLKKLVKDGLNYVLCVLTITNYIQQNQLPGQYLQVSIEYGINQKRITTLKRKKVKVLSESVRQLMKHQKNLDIFILKHVKNRFSINQNLIKQPDFFFSDFIDTYKVISFLKKIKYQSQTLYLISSIKVFSQEINEQIYMQTYVPAYSKYFLYIIPSVNFIKVIKMFLNNYISKNFLPASISKTMSNESKLVNKKTNTKRLSIWQRQNTPKKYQEQDEKYLLEEIKQMNSKISSMNSQTYTQKRTSQKIFFQSQKEVYQRLKQHKHKSRLSQYFRFKQINDNLLLQMGTDTEIYQFQASQILTKKLHFDCYTLKKKSKSSKRLNKQNAVKICQNQYLKTKLNELIFKPSAFQLVLLKHPVIRNLNKCRSFSYEIMKQLQLKKMYIKCDPAIYHEQHTYKKILELMIDETKNNITLKKMNSNGFSFQKSILFSTLSMLKLHQGEGFIKRSRKSKLNVGLQGNKKVGNFVSKASFESNTDKIYEHLKHKVLTYKNIIEYSKKIQQNFSEVIKKQQRQKNSIIYISASQYCQQLTKQFKTCQLNRSNRFKFVKLIIGQQQESSFLSQKVRKLHVLSIYNQPLSEIDIFSLRQNYPFIQKLGFKSLKKFLLRIVRDQAIIKNKMYQNK